MKRWLWLLLIVLATATIVAYYALHRLPLRLEPVMVIVDLLLGMALIALAGGIGRRLAPSPAGIGNIEAAAIEAAIGAGIIAALVFVAGLSVQ